MSFFKKLFGVGPPTKQPKQPEPQRPAMAKIPPPKDPAQDPTRN